MAWNETISSDKFQPFANTSVLPPLRAQEKTLTRLDVVLLSFYVLIFLVGIFGNSLVCIYFKFTSKKVKIMEYMILWLALSDLLASIVNPSLYAYWQLTFRKKWHFGAIGCKILPVLAKSSTSFSLGIIMLINIDRCIAITKPFRPKLTKSTVNLAVLVIFCIAISFEIPFVVYARVIPNNTCVVPSIFIKGFTYPTLGILILRDFLFLTVFISTVVTIYLALNDQTIITMRDKRRREKNKAILIMLTTIALVFTVLVFPREILHVAYIISWLRGNGIPYTVVIRNLNAVFKILHMCNSVCNVFIYAGLHRRFRKEVTNKVSEKKRAVKRKISNVLLNRSNGIRNTIVLAEQDKYETRPTSVLLVSEESSSSSMF